MSDQPFQTHHETPEAQPGTDIIHPEWRKWAAEEGVELSQEGLILPSPDTDKLDRKIAGNLDDVAARIQAAQQQGKDVLYMPGSYDLVHLGHLSFVDQARDFYIEQAVAQGRELTYDDLFIVTLADDDWLIEKIKAGKYVGNGGAEMFRRPVERGVDENGRSPRLDALATMPVDVVGFIPDPTTTDLPEPYDIDLAGARHIAESMFGDEKQPSMLKIIDSYEALEDLAHRHVSFEQAEWRIAAWQLFVTLAIAKPADIANEPQSFSGQSVTRIVSARESYSDAVRLITRLAGLGLAEVHDKQLVSTSELLERFGPETLVSHKATALMARHQS
jgi:hypothetical protein